MEIRRETFKPYNDVLQIQNNGPDIVETNFWDTEMCKRGFILFSINAGYVRMLLPPSKLDELRDIRTGKYVVLSKGFSKGLHRQPMYELMFEDFSDTPFAIYTGTEQWILHPEEKSVGEGWMFSVWDTSGKILEMPMKYRIVKEIPCLDQWGAVRKNGRTS